MAPGKRSAENSILTPELEAVFQERRGLNGSPRIHQELWASGRRIARHRVARLMQQAELRGITRKPGRAAPWSFNPACISVEFRKVLLPAKAHYASASGVGTSQGKPAEPGQGRRGQMVWAGWG
ncbi:IS3 family transposase [Synechococcus sp. 1G10]|uniref:IS3 family transposase n=1 Tax=Synechococcus sp. 1G10 TaxID=2025605 RepID=UPI0013037FCE